MLEINNKTTKRSGVFESESGVSPFELPPAEPPAKPKAKETFLVLSTVLLLLALGLASLSVLYYTERSFRLTLQAENDKTKEILKACDRFELGDIQNRFSNQLVHLPSNCPPCKKCHNYRVDAPSAKHKKKIESIKENIDAIKAQVAKHGVRSNRVEDAVRLMSRELLFMKFGSSVSQYTAELTLQLRSGSSQTSSLQLVFPDVAQYPYAMYRLLSQFHDGSWDGCSFTAYHKGLGVLLAEAKGPDCNIENFEQYQSLSDATLWFSEEPGEAAMAMGGKTTTSPANEPDGESSSEEEDDATESSHRRLSGESPAARKGLAADADPPLVCLSMRYQAPLPPPAVSLCVSQHPRSSLLSAKPLDSRTLFAESMYVCGDGLLLSVTECSGRTRRVYWVRGGIKRGDVAGAHRESARDRSSCGDGHCLVAPGVPASSAAGATGRHRRRQSPHVNTL